MKTKILTMKIFLAMAKYNRVGSFKYPGAQRYLLGWTLFFDFIKSFNGKLRDELLNEEVFSRLADAAEKLEDWCRDYDEQRFHGALGNKVQMDLGSGPINGIPESPLI